MWSNLLAYNAKNATARIADLFDANRAAQFSAQLGDLLFDYSKTTIDAPARALLLALLDDAGVAAKRAAMFSGQRVNETEGRAVLHTALRDRKSVV